MITLEKLSEFSSAFYGPVPFTIGEYSYATDGHIMLRVRALDGATGEKTPKNPDKLFEKLFAEGPMLPASIELPEEVISSKKCWECQGEGTINHSDCPTCSCEDKCEDCGGTGKTPISSDDGLCVKIGGFFFGARLIRRIKTLPNVRFCSRVVKNAMSFQFDTGDGLVMRLTDKSENVVVAKLGIDAAVE